MKGLRTESLKKEVKVHAQMLRDKERKEEAILFFCDIKAKGVLLAILAERRTGVGSFHLNDCLILLDVEDLVGLYEAAIGNSEVMVWYDGRLTGMRSEIVRRMADRAAAILQMPDLHHRDRRLHRRRREFRQSPR